MRNSYRRDFVTLRQTKRNFKQPRQHVHVPVPVQVRRLETRAAHLADLLRPIRVPLPPAARSACASFSSKLSGPLSSSPRSFTRLVTSLARRHRFSIAQIQMHAYAQSRSLRATSTPDANAAPFASREALVTIPLRCASAMPRLTPSVHPRSSALTIRFLNLRLSFRSWPVLSYSYPFVRHHSTVPLTVFPLNSSMTF